MKERDTDSAKAEQEEDTDPELVRLQEGIEHTRADMSATIASIQTRIGSEEVREKVSAELTHVEERVRVVVREQMNEADEKIKRGLGEARDALKQDVKEAISGAKQAVRAATLGQVEDLATNIGDKMNEARDTLVDTVRNNPIPAAITGFGLVWLLMNRSKSSKARMEGGANGGGSNGNALSQVKQSVSGFGHQLSDTTGKALGQASDAASSALHGISDKAAGLAHSASDTASHLAHEASDVAASAAKSAQQGVKRVEASFQTQLQDHPVALGAAALVVGAVVGFSLPRTAREDQLLGETRDRLLNKAGDAAHGAAASVTGAAEKALDAVKEAGHSTAASA